MNFPLGKRLRNNFLEIPLEYSTHYLKWGHYGTYWTSIHLNFYKEPPENILLDNKQGQRLYSKAWVMLKCLINHSFYCRKLVEIKKNQKTYKDAHFRDLPEALTHFLMDVWACAQGHVEQSSTTQTTRTQQFTSGFKISGVSPQPVVVMKSEKIGQPSTNYWQKSQAQLYWGSLASLTH